MIITILVTLLTATLFSTIAAAKNSSEENEIFGLIESEISIQVDSQADKPIGPSETKEIEITVKYKLNIGPFANWFFFNRRIGRLILFGPGYILKSKQLPKATVNLSITECPDWCTAELDTAEVEFEFSNTFEEAEAKPKLKILVNEAIPALKKADIVIKGEFLGHWTMKAVSNTTAISLISAYVSNITYEAEIEQAIPPLKNTTIPINIKNDGNGETTVEIQIEEQPENWNISLDQQNITLPINETGQINLDVIPAKGFDKGIITLKLIPESTSEEDVDDIHLEGIPVTLSITIHNDGSLKEENGISVETLIPILVVIIIIVAAFFIIMFLKKRKQ